MDRRSFIGTLGATLLSVKVAEGRWHRRNRCGVWVPSRYACGVPDSLFISDGVLPTFGIDVDLPDNVVESSWAIRWNGDFRRNFGEMTDHHKVSIYQGINDGGRNGRILGKTYGHCKNYGNPLRLDFGFQCRVSASTNPAVFDVFSIAKLDLGESKDAPWKAYRVSEYARYARYPWYMYIRT